MLGVVATYWSQLDCRGFYVGFDSDLQAISFIVETHRDDAWVKVRFVYI